MSVTIIGDVRPYTAEGGFTFPEATDSDDGAPDGLSSTGNTLDTSLIDTNPTGGAGLAWDDRDIYRNYSSAFDVVIGVDNSGSVTVSGSELRPQSVLLGVSDGSYGSLRLTGFDAEVNTDNDDIPSGIREAISLAKGTSSGARILEPEDVTAANLRDTGGSYPDENQRRDGSYDVWIGQSGSASLVVENGSQLRVRHRLMLGEPTSPSNAAGTGTLIVRDGGNVTHVGLVGDGTAAAPQSVCGVTSTIRLEGGRLSVGAGLNSLDPVPTTPAMRIKGVIEVRPSESPSELDGSYQLAEGALLVVRAGAVLKISGSLINDGLIFRESGSVVMVDGVVSGDGRNMRSPCNPQAIWVDGEDIDFAAASGVALDVA